MRIWQVDECWEMNTNGEAIKNYIVQRTEFSKLNVLRLYVKDGVYQINNMVRFDGDVKECEETYTEITPDYISKDIKYTFNYDWSDKEILIEGYDLYCRMGELL